MPQAEPVAAPLSDAALIAAWQGGDEQAAAELVRRHARALARFLSGAGAVEADLDDLVQDTFIRAFRSVGKFRGQCQFRTWLLTIERRLLLDRRRSEKRRPDRVEIHAFGAGNVRNRARADKGRLGRRRRRLRQSGARNSARLSMDVPGRTRGRRARRDPFRLST